LSVDGGWPPSIDKGRDKASSCDGIMHNFSALGLPFKSIIIRKDLKSLKSLLHYTALTSFASSCSGWITGDVFTMFAIYFCSQLSLYRLSLPSDIADELVLLLLDGHISQRNITALMIFIYLMSTF
jgi:hypothetical protein